MEPIWRGFLATASAAVMFVGMVMIAAYGTQGWGGPRPGVIQHVDGAGRVIATGVYVAPTATPRPSSGRISLAVASEYPLSPDRGTYETMARATRENDRATLLRIAGQGLVTLVPNGTPVRVLETDMNLLRVEVSGGPMRGRSGWLPSNLVGP